MVREFRRSHRSLGARRHELIGTMALLMMLVIAGLSGPSRSSGARAVAVLSGGTCTTTGNERAVETTAEHLLGKKGPLGPYEITEVSRYPGFHLTTSGHGHQALIHVHPLSYKGPAGFYGSKSIPQAPFARMAISADCRGYLHIMRMERKRGCYPSYSPGPGKPDWGAGYICETKWWPAGNKGCHDYGDGSLGCEWLVRKVSLGRTIQLHVPNRPNFGVQAFIEVPDLVILNQCICLTSHLPAQEGGNTNLLFLR